MEDNFIYDDLVSQGDLGAIIHDLQTRKNELELDIKKLCDKITEMKAVQDNLSRNISELFNTARNELNRKDRRIADLQKQVDDLIFRRNTTQSNFGNKRKREVLNREESNKKFRNETAKIVPIQTESDDCNIYSATEKSAHKEGRGLIDRVNPDSNSRDLSRNESDRSGKTPCSRENSDRRERSAQKEEDSHKTIIEGLNPDPSSYDSSKQESDRSGKASYSKEISYRRDRSAHREEGSHRRTIDRSNQDSRDSSKHESDRTGKSSYSRDNSNRRDRRDDHRNKRDGYKDTNSFKDNRVDNRGGQRNHREERHRNRSYRDSNEACRNNDYRNSKRDYRDTYEYRDNQRGDKNAHPEDSKHTSDSHRNETNESRNLRGDKIDDFNYFGDQQMDQESKRESVLSAAESTEIPSESLLDKVDALDRCREDGELSDEEILQVPEVAKKEQVASKKMDFGKNLPFDEKKSFSVHKFVEKQKGMLKKEENLVSQNEKNNTHMNTKYNKVEDPSIQNFRKQLEKPESKDRKMQRNMDKGVEVQNVDPVAENKRVENGPDNKISSNLKPVKNIALKVQSNKMCATQNPKKNGEPKEEISKLCPREDSSQNIESIPEKNKIYTKEKELMDEIRQLSCEENPTKNEESNEEDTKCDAEINNTNVHIISEFILHEGKKKDRLIELRQRARQEKKEIHQTGGGTFSTSLSESDHWMLSLLGDNIRPWDNPYDDASIYFGKLLCLNYLRYKQIWNIGTSVVFNEDNNQLRRYNMNIRYKSDPSLNYNASADSSKPKQEDQHKCRENKDKDKPPIIVPKLNKPKRESRVPRNLTDELNINLERSNKMKKYMTQLFGSPDTKPTKPFEQFSPTLSVGLSHDGEIPDLELLSNRDPLDTKTNSQASDVTNTSNPVTEFQIFKSNLPSLEKSNSLSNIVVQIQTPDNSTMSKEPMDKSISAIEDDAKESSKEKGISDKLAAKQGPISTQGTIENVIQSSSDVCNVSLDLLNMDIGECKAEDFPNLIAHSDFKDMSDLLLTPVNSAVKKVARTQKIIGTSAKILSDENKLEPSNQIPAINKELSGQCTNTSNLNKKEMQHTNKCVPNEKLANVPKQSSNINVKEKKQNVTKKTLPKTEKIVSAKNVANSPRKYINKNKIDNKLKTDSHITKAPKTVNPVIADEKICNDPQELKNGNSSKQEANVITDSKDIHNEIKDTPKGCTTTSKSRKQNMTNVNKKTVNKTIAESSEKPVDTSNKKTNVNKEHSENAVSLGVTNSVNKEHSENAVSLGVTNSVNISCKRRRRCSVRWK